MEEENNRSREDTVGGRKELRRKRWEEERKRDADKREKEKVSRKQKNRILGYGLLVIVAVGVIGGLYFLITSSSDTSNTGLGSGTGEDVHWHPTVTMSLCGEQKYIPMNAGGHGIVHTHGDVGVLHVEGRISSEKDATLGKAFDAIGIPFTDESIYDYKNGDTCPDGTVGQLKVFVDGEKSEVLRDLTLKNAQQIRIEFG